MIKFFFIFFILVPFNFTRASSCCGSSAAVPGLIMTGEKVKFNLSQTQAQIIGDVAADGVPVFRKNQDRAFTQTSLVQLSVLLNETMQAGFSTSAIANSGAGDTSVYGAWEAYPEGSFEDKGLRGIFFSKLIIPTGKSVYEIDSSSGSQVTGQGFYNLAIGHLWALRRWDWDFNTSVLIGNSFAKDFKTATGNFTVLSSQNADFNFGFGYSWKNFRVGTDLTAHYQFPKRTVLSSGMQTGDESYWWPVSIAGSYFMANSSYFQLSYNDETLLGPVKNCNLNRSLLLAYSYRFF